MRLIFFILIFAVARAHAAPVDYQKRGIEHFFNAEIDAAIKDFDTYLSYNPRAAPQHWQRGIALYYAGRFDEGAVQFEIHREVNPRDVENAVWLFLCNARAISLTTARASIIPYTYDPRVPMRQIHALFAGTGTKQAVLDAARRGNPSSAELRNRLCYAHFYLGLHAEAYGDRKLALEHIKKAATTYSMPHYMGKTAKVHLKLGGPRNPVPGPETIPVAVPALPSRDPLAPSAELFPMTPFEQPAVTKDLEDSGAE